MICISVFLCCTDMIPKLFRVHVLPHYGVQGQLNSSTVGGLHDAIRAVLTVAFRCNLGGVGHLQGFKTGSTFNALRADPYQIALGEQRFDLLINTFCFPHLSALKCQSYFALNDIPSESHASPLSISVILAVSKGL